MKNRILDTQFPMAALLTATLLLGLSSTCDAITIGIGGEVLLVPYVLCETDDTGGAPIFNTMIGVTTEPLLDTSIYTPASAASLYAPVPVPAPGVHPFSHTMEPHRNVSWVFFDTYGNRRLSGSAPASANDFVAIDWCAVGGATARVNGQPGYMFITSPPRFRMWAQAYLIRDDWASMAFIPVIALDDRNRIAVNRPPHFRYMNELGRDRFKVALRYFVDPDLATANEFVFWFDRPCPGGVTAAGTRVCDRTRVSGNTFDPRGVSRFPSTIDLSHPLNIYHFSMDDPSGSLPGNTPWLPRTAQDKNRNRDTSGYDQDLANTGYIVFDIPEDQPSRTSEVSNGDYPRHVIFSLIFIAGTNNASQAQTELGQERGYR